MSCFLCCFKSLSLCGFRDCLLSMIAFHPPKEHRYEIKSETPDPKKPPFYRLVVPEPGGTKYQPKDADGVESSIFWLQTRTSRLIPAIFLENKKATSNYVILYSHGNSTDLGRMRLTLQELCLALNVHVFAYEYTGYGPTNGKPSDIEVIFCIIAAYQFLTEKMKIRWHEIILYGRSIGSGPSLYLASHPKYPVSGVILHSPIASGLRMLDVNMKDTHNKDLFPNTDFIKHVKAHVFVMHGEEDREVPITHGKLLSSNCKNLYHPWWVPEGTHNDIDLKFRKIYFMKLSKFVKHIKDFNLTRTEKELDNFYRVKEWHQSFNHIYFTETPKIEEKYQKYLQKGQKPIEYGSFSSNSSFLTNHNATNITFKTNTESIITTLGDQTVRRNGQETIRSARSNGPEERKIEPPLRVGNLETVQKSKGQEIEFSYSYRSHTERTGLKSDNRDLSPVQSEPMNLNQIGDQLPNEMSFEQIAKQADDLGNIKVEINDQAEDMPMKVSNSQ